MPDLIIFLTNRRGGVVCSRASEESQVDKTGPFKISKINEMLPCSSTPPWATLAIFASAAKDSLNLETDDLGFLATLHQSDNINDLLKGLERC